MCVFVLFCGVLFAFVFVCFFVSFLFLFVRMIREPDESRYILLVPPVKFLFNLVHACILELPTTEDPCMVYLPTFTIKIQQL